MEQTDRRAALQEHQRAAQLSLKKGVDAVRGGVGPTLAALPQRRAELAMVLNAYQAFKHDEIFNPAVTSGDPERASLGRAMKVQCIVAGEVFRSSLGHWKETDIVGSWANYKIVMRLAAGQLMRHIDNEREGILRLIDLAGTDRTDKC